MLFIARNRWGIRIFRNDRRGHGFTGMACKIFDRSKLVPCKNSRKECTKICWLRSSRARSARSRAPWVRKWNKLPFRENLVITLPYTARPPAARETVRPPAPQGNQCSISPFLASLGADKGWYWTHWLNALHINVVINWQLSKQDIRWPVSPDRIADSGVDPSGQVTFWSYPLTSY